MTHRFLKFLTLLGLSTLSMIATATTGDAKDLKRVGYFSEWSVYDKEYDVADIPAQHLTHVVYMSAVIDPVDNVCMLNDIWAALEKEFPEKNKFPAQNGNFARLQELKSRYPQLTLLLSVGDKDKSEEFSPAVTAPNIEHFAQSCIDLMNQYHFDGLHIDWQYPASADDQHNLTAFLHLLKNKLTPGQELTLTGPGNSDNMANIEFKKLSDGRIVNAIHILSYDYHDTTYHVAAHQAPLYATDTQKSVDAAVQAYLTAGVQPELLVLGIPLYGRAWTVSDPSETTLQHGLYQPIVRPTQEQATLLDYAQIHQMIEEKALTIYTDPIAHATYAFSTNTGLFVTYDSIESVKEKVEYAKTKHLGGLLFWSLESDMRQGVDSLVSAAQ